MADWQIEQKNDFNMKCIYCSALLYDALHAINHLGSFHTIQSRELMQDLYKNGKLDVSVFTEYIEYIK
jgi:hypothetical protein